MNYTESEYIEYLENKEPELTSENPNSKWYLIQTQSNCESKARKNIASRLVLLNLTDKVDQILFPAYEKIVTNVGGQKRKKMEKIFGNYLFVLADMDEKVYNAIKDSGKVSGFVQSGASSIVGMPKPISDKEVRNVISKLNMYKTGELKTNKFKSGDTVRVLNGVFADHFGVVDNIKGDKVIVNVTLFGRSTPIDLTLKDIQIES